MNSTWIITSGPISARQKHYSLVWYILNDIIRNNDNNNDDDDDVDENNNVNNNSRTEKSHIVIRNTWGTIATIVNFKILNYGCSKELDYCTV